MADSSAKALPTPGVRDGDTRSKILRGTAAAVGELGLRNVTVQSILDRGEVSRRTFYKFFGGLEDALSGLLDLTMDVFERRLMGALEGELEPTARIVRAVDAYLELQLVGGSLIIELQAEAIRPDSQLCERRLQVMDRLVESLRPAIEAATQREIDPTTVRGLLMGLEGLVLMSQRTGRFTPEDRDMIRTSFLPTIMRAVGLHDLALAPA